MKIFRLLPLLVLLLAQRGYSQPALQFNAVYLQAPEWDKIIQTYNFARPWQQEKLTPLSWGYQAAFSWNWRVQASREIHLLPELAYTWFQSQIQPDQRKISLGSHVFQTGLTLRMHPKCLLKPVQGAGPIGTRFYLGLGAGLTSFLPYKKVDGENFHWNNGEVYRELSFAPHVQVSAGYHLTVIGMFAITPELAILYLPSAELRKYAEVVNGHNLTGLRNATDNVFFLRAGVRITYLKPQKNWWDRPRQGDKT